MKRFVSLATALVLVLVLALPATAADPYRPMKGTVTGADSMGAPVDCPAWGQWRYQSRGTGRYTHLGFTSFHVSHCSAMTGPTVGQFGAGTMTLTAANGDTLILRDWGTFDLTVGSAGPTRSDIDLNWEVVGGTGRFEDAHGSGGGAGYSELATGTTTMRLWGEISY
jgi:hypothetical protein